MFRLTHDDTQTQHTQKTTGRLNNLRAEKAKCLEKRLREAREVRQSTAVCRHGSQRIAATTTATATSAQPPLVSPRTPTKQGHVNRNTDKDEDRSSLGGANIVNPKGEKIGEHDRHFCGVSPEQERGLHGLERQPGVGIKAGYPAKDHQCVEVGDDAGGSGDDDDVHHRPSRLPSSWRRTKTEDTSTSRSNRSSQQAAEADDAWEILRDRDRDDEILKVFLARHAEEACPPLEERVAGECPRRRGCDADEGDERLAGLGSPAAGSEWGLKVLW